MKNPLSIVAAISAFLAANAVAGADVQDNGGRLVLAGRGSAAPCAIAVKDGDAPSVRYAAEELRDHVKKITGAAMKIVSDGPEAQGAKVSIALSDDASLGDDGFEIKSTADSLSVLGGKRGVIYGVHELLERYGGVMWLSPSHTRIPEADAFAVPAGLSMREKPAFLSRHLSTFNCWKNQDFCVRLRLTETTVASKFGGVTPAFDPVLGKCHTFGRLVPAYRYYKTHPEYFSLVKGKRLDTRPQLCLTNPDVFEIALSNVLARIEANKADRQPHRRAVRFYGVSQDDWNNYCECENCAAIDAREESHAGCVIWFVNKIAEAVEKKHPDVIIETLAYLYGRKPPKYLKPRDNVMICLCTIECDFSKPMASNRYKENVDFRTNVLKWREIAKNLYLWDYAANWRATPVPYPNLNAYAENIRFYHETGVRHLYEEGFRSPSASFTDLKGWLGAKLMWNPYQPAEPLVRRFCEAYYGKAAPIVLDFIKFMGEQEIDETKTPLTYAVTLQKMPFTRGFYEKGREMWAKAEEAVADESEQIRKNVAWGRFGLEYALAGMYSQSGNWKAAVLSRNVAAKLDRAEYMKMRESARYCQRIIDAAREIDEGMVSSRLNDFRLRGYLRALAESEFPDSAPSKVLIQDWAFQYSDHPKSLTIFREKDKDATDGRVLSLKGEKNPWSVTCAAESILALDKGRRYRLRAHIKVQPDPAAPAGKTMFSMGLFDRFAKKAVCRLAIRQEQATGRYEWYDFGEWDYAGHDCMFYMEPRGSKLSFDCIEVSACEGGNLLRDDFTPDNIGGILGWRIAIDGGSKVDVSMRPLAAEKPGDPPAVRLLCKPLGACPSAWSFRPEVTFPLLAGQRYRLSAQMRTHGLLEKDISIVRMVLADEHWRGGPGIQAIPGDTGGAWRDFTWEGTFDPVVSNKEYMCTLYVCSKKSGFPEDAWIDIRALRLEGPVGPDYDRSALANLRPMPLRVTPVDPLLSELRPENVEMLFYCAAAGDKFRSGEPKVLRATAAGRTVTVPFGPDGRARAAFGPMAEGKINLRAELVGADSGKTYASNDYRAYVRGEIANATPMKRLNNFVSELVRRPYSEGEIPFTLAKDEWMYVALSDLDAKVEAAFDGKPAKFFREAGRLELMRNLSRGRHVLSLKGAAKGEVIVRRIKCIYRSALHKAERMAPNFTDYNYGEEFYNAFGLFGGMNMTAVPDISMDAPKTRRLVDMMQERGVDVAYSYGMKYTDPRRAALDGYISFVTSRKSYVAGRTGQFDENCISLMMGARAKANAAEAWWRAYEDGRLVNVFLCDGAGAIPSNPHLDIPEISAYVNAGDGRGKIIAEAYYLSPETPADFERRVDLAKRQQKAFRELVPASPSRFFYLFNGWVMIGGWTSWYTPANDLRAFNAEMLRVFATDPDFAEVGGAAFSTPACYEDLFRFSCAMIRYYCIEGGADSFAAMNGMSMWPRHIENGDFTDGFDGWTAESADPGSLAPGHRDGIATPWQGRILPGGRARDRDCPGCDFAVFTQSAKGPNTLRRRIKGLEPGRVYQLTCAISDLATMNRGMDTKMYRKVKPVNIPYMGIRIEGAEEIPELRHVFDDIGKYGRLCVFPHRVVFRAKTSEAEVVFCDWKDDGVQAVADGQQTMLNYIGVYPYFYQGEEQLDALKRFTKQAKDMK